ncbi:MAG TPA: glycosyltransferase [Actinomycetota bacterium]|nr:glycosyltransferase [Actinomycetota bacterium]
MRIAMVSEHASPLAALGGVDAGGQNVHVASLASQMAKQGAQVVVYTRRTDADLPRRVRSGNVTVEHVTAGPAEEIPKDELLPYMDEFAEELRHGFRRYRPDIVHSHFWMSGRAALAAAPPATPVVHTFHALGVVKRRNQGDRDTSPPERLAEEDAILRRADHIIATCTDEVFELKRLGASADQVSVVPCGVDLELFTADGPAEERADGRFRIVVLSRIVERKGIADAITALAELPEAELVIAGGPPAGELDADPEVQRLRRVAAESGVADRVAFRGRIARAAVPPLLRSADVVVSVPWYEPFGIVPLEAMACGRPLVVSAVGGMIDSVVHGITGLHVPPRSPRPLAEALRLLAADEALRCRLGAQGRQRAESKYGWPLIAQATLQVYRNVLGVQTSAKRSVMP